MSHAQNSTALAPLRQHVAPHAVAACPLPDVNTVVANLRPQEPLHCVRPAAIAASAAAFVNGFQGDVLYAVKCNPEPAVLRAIWAGGIRHFDCASIAEVALVRDLFPGAAIHFMHPVKSRAAIAQAWGTHGVRDYVFDTSDELQKILAEIPASQQGGPAAKPGLLVRLALPSTGAAIDLSSKFGAAPQAAAHLLRAASPHAAKLGLAFHVGSQCMDPLAWRDALALAGAVIHLAGVPVDIIDVGGGFPVAYPEIEPPPLSAFMAEIHAGWARLNLPGVKLWAEPGRALVAGGGSLVVQVQLRKADMLYVNDGVFGSLSDAGMLGFRFPTRLIRATTPADTGAPLRAFSFFGPTCDSNDIMQGPFMLPEDISEGDWVEIGQLGAYGTCLRTGFNGFDRATITEVRDNPMLPTAGYEPTPAVAPPAVATPSSLPV